VVWSRPDILGVWGRVTNARYAFKQVIELTAAGHYPQDGWVEHIGLDGVRDGLERLRRGGAMKLLVDLP
jgi:threonine dehydrogenase-like Zn-dependent dehydrogenase